MKIGSFPKTKLADNAVFLPSRELLSLYPGLVSLFETRETAFDETWRDTAVYLGMSALRGPRSVAANNILEPISEEIEGNVVEENGRFYVRLPNSGSRTAKLEAPLVSEGYRKLVMIIRLVSNGVLLEGGYLFWDEPEANLNPRTQRAAAKAIIRLAESGTQVFVASHSVFLLREIEMLLNDGQVRKAITPTYISMQRDRSEQEDGPASGKIRVTTTTDPEGPASIVAHEEESDQAMRYLEMDFA